MILIKRVYEPRARGDGRRILVERLWPRGIKKETLEAEAWMKEVAPSTALRQWFGHRVERWEEFTQRYRQELAANGAAWAPILDAAERGTVTLLYSARDVEHNSAVVLRDYLAQRRPASSRNARSQTAAGRQAAARSPARTGTAARRALGKDAASAPK